LKQDNRILRLDRISHTRLRRLDPDKTLVTAVLSPLEVHGPHLPIGQDWFEATAVTEKTLERVSARRGGWTFLLLPPVPLVDDCLPHFGSVNIPAYLVREVAHRMLEPFAKRGFARLAYTSFHGGPRHMTALEAAADDLTREYDTQAVSLFSAMVGRMGGDNVFYEAVKDHPDNELTHDEISIDWHAGFVETSLGLYLWPEMVNDGWQDLPPAVKKMPRGKDDRGNYFMDRKSRDPLNRIEGAVKIARSVKAAIEHYSKFTYSGYPGKSSAELGRAMFEHVVDLSCEVMEEFLDSGTDMEIHTPLWRFRKVLLDRNLNRVLSERLGLYNDRK